MFNFDPKKLNREAIRKLKIKDFPTEDAEMLSKNYTIKKVTLTPYTGTVSAFFELDLKKINHNITQKQQSIYPD